MARDAQTHPEHAWTQDAERVGYDIVFEHPQPTPIVAMLYLHPLCLSAIRRNEYLLVDPQVPISGYSDGLDNRCGRLMAPAGRIRFWNDAVIEDGGQPERHNPAAAQHEIRGLPADHIVFLLASRYCEVDRMMATAGNSSARYPPAGCACKPSAITCTATSASTTCRRAIRARRSRRIKSGWECVAISRTSP